MFDIDEPIDLGRVVFDPSYRRDVIEYLNHQAEDASRRKIIWSMRGKQGMSPASIRGGREAALAVVQAKP